MAAPRKIFRIEQDLVTRLSNASASSPRHAEIVQALTALATAGAATAVASRSAGAAPLTRQADRLTRVAQELDAVTTGTAQATHKILEAAEQIDRLANNLSAALIGQIEQNVAQDISDMVSRIFEACNFQDLIGQRVNKVMSTLNVIEDHIAHALDDETAPSDAAMPPALHGPPLDGDAGHLSQHEIDALFGH